MRVRKARDGQVIRTELPGRVYCSSFAKKVGSPVWATFLCLSGPQRWTLVRYQLFCIQCCPGGFTKRFTHVFFFSMYLDADEVRLDELVSGSFPHSPAAANSSLKARRLRFCSRNEVM